MKKVFFVLFVFAFVALPAFGQVTGGWHNPPTPAPYCPTTGVGADPACFTPINTGSIDQTKYGNIIIATTSTALPFTSLGLMSGSNFARIYNYAGNLTLNALNGSVLIKDKTDTKNVFVVTPLGRLQLLGINNSGVNTYGDGKVLTSDANGYATWQPAASGGFWSRLGTALYPTTLNDNVGIGTKTPDARLVVKGLAAPAPSAGNVMKGLDAGGGAAWQISNTVEAPNYFLKGNVGIGTNAPIAKLDVAGNTRIGGTVKIEGGSPGTNKILVSNDATGQASWKTQSESFRKYFVERVDDNTYKLTSPDDVVSYVYNAKSIGDGSWKSSSDGRLRVCRSNDHPCASANGGRWDPPAGTGMIEITRAGQDHLCILAIDDDDRPKNLITGGDRNGNSCSVSGQRCLKLGEKDKEWPLDPTIDQVGFVCFE